MAALTPLKRGGTGSRSEHEEQPAFLPDRYESGTPNAVGLAGLAAGVRWVLAQGIERIRDHERALTGELLAAQGLTCRMIPVPRQVGSDCGACVRILQAQVDAARQTVTAAGIEIQGIEPI